MFPAPPIPRLLPEQPPEKRKPVPPVGRRFVKGQPGGPGRPSKMAVWREQVEAEFDEWVKPYREALTSAVVSTAYQGDVFTSEVPDLEARMRAAERVFDRVFGKPQQSVTVDGELHVSLERVLLDDASEQVDS